MFMAISTRSGQGGWCPPACSVSDFGGRNILPVGRVLISPSGLRIVIVIVCTSVARVVGILDRIFCHHPSKRTDCISNILGVRRRSLAERIERLPRASEAFVEESVEVFLRYCVDGVVIEQVPPQRDVGSSGRDQIPAPLWPPNTTSTRMVCINSIDPEESPGEN